MVMISIFCPDVAFERSEADISTSRGDWRIVNDNNDRPVHLTVEIPREQSFIQCLNIAVSKSSNFKSHDLNFTLRFYT